MSAGNSLGKSTALERPRRVALQPNGPFAIITLKDFGEGRHLSGRLLGRLLQHPVERRLRHFDKPADPDRRDVPPFGRLV